MQPIQLAQLQQTLGRDDMTNHDHAFQSFLNCSHISVARVIAYDTHTGTGTLQSMLTGETMDVERRALQTCTDISERWLFVGEYVEYEPVVEHGRTRAIHVRGVCGGPLMCEPRLEQFTLLSDKGAVR